MSLAGEISDRTEDTRILNDIFQLVYIRCHGVLGPHDLNVLLLLDRVYASARKV